MRLRTKTSIVIIHFPRGLYIAYLLEFLPEELKLIDNLSRKAKRKYETANGKDIVFSAAEGLRLDPRCAAYSSERHINIAFLLLK